MLFTDIRRQTLRRNQKYRRSIDERALARLGWQTNVPLPHAFNNVESEIHGTLFF
jgi:hypothetical protein